MRIDLHIFCLSSGDSTSDGTNLDQYANESFELEVSEVKTLESQTTLQTGSQSGSQKEQVQPPLKIDYGSEARFPRMSERSNKYPGVTIKVPLSPRLQRVQRRRYSSGSDDSMVLSQTGLYRLHLVLLSYFSQFLMNANILFIFH